MSKQIQLFTICLQYVMESCIFSPCHMDKYSLIDPSMVSNNPVREYIFKDLLQ